MKTKFIFFFLLFLHANSFCQVPSKETEKALLAKAQRIEKTYQLVISNKSNLKYQQQFFKEFPDNFYELKHIYGYDGILKDKPWEHIFELFNQIQGVPDKDYYNKLINIAIGGTYEADGINYFNGGLRSHCLSNPSLIFSLLKNHSEKEVFSFWYFYFDGPHPDEKAPEEFLPLKVSHSKTYNIMESARIYALKMNEE